MQLLNPQTTKNAAYWTGKYSGSKSIFEKSLCKIFFSWVGCCYGHGYGYRNIRVGKKMVETFLVSFSLLPFGENLSKSITVSTKIPKQLKEKIDRLKIKPSKLLRKAIEDEIKKRETEELKEEIDKLKPILEKISVEDIVKNIREDRDNR
jgi:antitoxin CcdA